jgi:hypothetical protein
MSDDEDNDSEADSESKYEELEKANVASTPDEDPRENDDGESDDE